MRKRRWRSCLRGVAFEGKIVFTCQKLPKPGRHTITFHSFSLPPPPSAFILGKEEEEKDTEGGEDDDDSTPRDRASGKRGNRTPWLVNCSVVG